MPVSIKGTGGGSVTLSAAAAATDTTLTLPNTSGTVMLTGTTIPVANGGTGLTSVGASGNVLTSNGTAWVSSAPVATASLTLLATLTTTSGTTQSVTGLATTYTNLVLVFNGVNNSTGNDFLYIEASINSGSTWGTSRQVTGASPSYGGWNIYLANGSLTNRPCSGGTTYPGAVTTINTTAASPINGLRFSWLTGYTFNAGTIYIYGWN